LNGNITEAPVDSPKKSSESFKARVVEQKEVALGNGKQNIKNNLGPELY
jgi:hypothetical protein